ncbi:hypothetical protein DMC30DRAFT_82852 [Rhodotorula diobovata]|uniref:Uncharacterized protein n=1 Tax=Rhodotorula diobovata TaxID=5288 RepID=A0A5C5FMB1_9BASI|nr:hypothetical protein DMC30DRAFT_82852 [Rhodotorula diobovata]
MRCASRPVSSRDVRQPSADGAIQVSEWHKLAERAQVLATNALLPVPVSSKWKTDSREVASPAALRGRLLTSPACDPMLVPTDRADGRREGSGNQLSQPVASTLSAGWLVCLTPTSPNSHAHQPSLWSRDPGSVVGASITAHSISPRCSISLACCAESGCAVTAMRWGADLADEEVVEEGSTTDGPPRKDRRTGLPFVSVCVGSKEVAESGGEKT